MKKIGKTDLIIILSVIVIGIGLVAVFLLTNKTGSEVVVAVDGNEVARYGLDEEIDTVIKGIGGSNRLIIRGGEAWIEDADCPDKLCVKQGRVSKTNESIVCLPHRITIRITGEADDGPDSVVSEVSPACRFTVSAVGEVA